MDNHPLKDCVSRHHAVTKPYFGEKRLWEKGRDGVYACGIPVLPSIIAETRCLQYHAPKLEAHHLHP